MALTVTITQFQGGVNASENEEMRGVANYLIWLCGRYGMDAKAIGGNPGGSVSPVNPGYGALNPLEFTVDDTSPIVTGGNTITLPQFIGYQLLFVRNGLTQVQYNTGTNTYYYWNPITGKFICYGDANEGDEFSLRPYK